MKIIADECVPYASVKVLKGAGINTYYTGRSETNMTDEEVILKASEEDRTLVTFDREFARAAVNSGKLNAQGVVLLNISYYDPLFPGQLLVKIIKSTSIKFRRKFSVISNNFIQQQKM